MATRKRSGQASKRSGGALPGWVWGLSGLAVGLFIAFLVHLEGSRSADETRDPIGDLLAPQAESAIGTATGDAPAPGGAEGDDGPRFEFYKLLPEQEVEVPQEPERSARTDSPPEPEAPATPSAPTEDGGSYLLQAGSFRNFDDADRLKASLALLGVEARIQEVELPGGETWHRVRVGPFSDRQEINRIRERLAENDVDAILLRAGG